MRIGVIEFGLPHAETAPLLAALRERGTDVIVRLDDPAPSIRDEAQRLHRADCDGILMTLGDGVQPNDVAEAMLHLHCPILVAGSGGALAIEAQTIASALAVSADDTLPSRLLPDPVASWLDENAKIQRQKGIAAAHKLYGARMIDGRGNSARRDGGFALKLRWLQQFGLLIRDATEPDAPREGDITAADGDTLGALTSRLLQLVAGADSVPAAVDRSQLVEGGPGVDMPLSHTIALVSTDQDSSAGPESASNFYGRILRGAQRPDGTFTVGRAAFAFLESDGDGKAVRFFAVAGDHVGSLHAALSTLDIPTVVLRGDLL